MLIALLLDSGPTSFMPNNDITNFNAATSIIKLSVPTPPLRQPTIFPKSEKAKVAGTSTSSQLTFSPKPNSVHDHYAQKMNNHASHGRQAMDILKEKLANASTIQDPAPHAQGAGVIGKQHTDLSCHTIPAIRSDSHAVQAPAPDGKGNAGSNELAVYQSVQHDALLSNSNGRNGLYEAPSASQQQNECHDTMLCGHTGALTIMPPAFNDDNVGRDVFSNDHLSSEIVPLEDPAEAFALSQSTVPIAIQRQRSRQLNILTCGPNQCPTAAAALSDDNFPFVEGARMAQATPTYGVIRLCDVSCNPSFLPIDPFSSNIFFRFLRPLDATRSWLSWAATPRS